METELAGSSPPTLPCCPFPSSSLQHGCEGGTPGAICEMTLGWKLKAILPAE